MKIVTIIIIGIAGMLACNRKVPAAAAVNKTVIDTPAIPTCIQTKIDEIKKQPVWNPPAQIQLYEYDGRKVYLLSADCCDFFNTVIDGGCNYICAPSGGFTGKGDQKCTDFSNNAKYIKLVWKDPRGK